MNSNNNNYSEKENNEMKIALKLLHLRQDNNISSGQFAEIIGISAKELSNYESAEESIPASLLFLVAKVFDIEIEYFYEEEFDAKESFMEIPLIQYSFSGQSKVF